MTSNRYRRKGPFIEIVVEREREREDSFVLKRHYTQLRNVIDKIKFCIDIKKSQRRDNFVFTDARLINVLNRPQVQSNLIEFDEAND